MEELLEEWNQDEEEVEFEEISLQYEVDEEIDPYSREARWEQRKKSNLERKTPRKPILSDTRPGKRRVRKSSPVVRRVPPAVPRQPARRLAGEMHPEKDLVHLERTVGGHVQEHVEGHVRQHIKRSIREHLGDLTAPSIKQQISSGRKKQRVRKTGRKPQSSPERSDPLQLGGDLNPLQQAVIFRRLLGPPRAQEPWRPGDSV